jgi:hypothetical protein
LDSLNLVNKLKINLYSEIIMLNEIISKVSKEQVFESKNTAEKWQMIFKNTDTNLTVYLKSFPFLQLLLLRKDFFRHEYKMARRKK